MSYQSLERTPPAYIAPPEQPSPPMPGLPVLGLEVARVVSPGGSIIQEFEYSGDFARSCAEAARVIPEVFKLQSGEFEPLSTDDPAANVVCIGSYDPKKVNPASHGARAAAMELRSDCSRSYLRPGEQRSLISGGVCVDDKGEVGLRLVTGTDGSSADLPPQYSAEDFTRLVDTAKQSPDTRRSDLVVPLGTITVPGKARRLAEILRATSSTGERVRANVAAAMVENGVPMCVPDNRVVFGGLLKMI